MHNARDELSDLRERYAAIWADEEITRCSAWHSFLAQHSHDFSAHGQGQQASMEALAALGIDIVVGIVHSQQSHQEERAYLELLVQAGCPASIRPTAWRAFLDISVRKMKHYYRDLVGQVLGDLQGHGQEQLSQEEIRHQVELTLAALDQLDGVPAAAPDQATEGSSSGGGGTMVPGPSWASHGRIWLQQIEKDLPRTFPQQPAGAPPHPLTGSRLKPVLRRILAAYALRNPTVGYCQGLNFLAGCLLLSGMEEEDAFYCLCTLVEDMLQGNFSSDMMATQVDTRVFCHLVEAEFPQVMKHLEGLGADISCVFVQWFLCIFVNFLPHETCLRVWDVLFYKRSSAVLFQVALAMVEIYSPALLATGDEIDAFQVVQSMAPLTFDSSRLVSTACSNFKHVNDKLLTSLRAQCTKTVREEIRAATAAEAAANLPAGLQPPPAVEGGLGGKMSMMKKLFQRLEKGAAEVGQKVLAVAREGSSEDLECRQVASKAGSPGGPSSPRWSSSQITGQEAVAAAATTSAPRNIPGQASVNSGGGGSDTYHDLLHSDLLFSQGHQDLIALSPPDGTIPDIDDLLFAHNSMKRADASGNDVDTCNAEEEECGGGSDGGRSADRPQDPSCNLGEEEGATADGANAGRSDSTHPWSSSERTNGVAVQPLDEGDVAGAAAAAGDAGAAGGASFMRPRPKLTSAAQLALEIAMAPWNMTGGNTPSRQDSVSPAYPFATSSSGVDIPFLGREGTVAATTALLDGSPSLSEAHSCRDDWISITMPAGRAASCAPPVAVTGLEAIGAGAGAGTKASLNVPSLPSTAGAPAAGGTAAAAAAAATIAAGVFRSSASSGGIPGFGSGGGVARASQPFGEEGFQAAVEELSEQLGLHEVLNHRNVLDRQVQGLKDSDGIGQAQSAIERLSTLQLAMVAMGSGRQVAAMSEAAEGDEESSSVEESTLTRLGSSPTSAARQLQHLLLSLADLQRDVRSCQQHQQDSMSTLEQYQVVCDVMGGQLQGAVASLVERNSMIDAMMKKQNELIAKLAMQDDEIVDLKWRHKGDTLDAAAKGKDSSKPWSKMGQMFKSRFKKDDGGE